MTTQEIRDNEYWDYIDPSRNLFLETSIGREALKRILLRKKTNVNYNWMMMYGLDKIKEDLDAALKSKRISKQECDIKGKIKTRIYLALESFIPDQLTQALARSEGLSHSVKYLMPIMPPVIIEILDK